MAQDKLREKLADYIEDAHAMERSVLRMLDSMISTTNDPEVVELLQNHKAQTEQHERRLRERLEALGRDTRCARRPNRSQGHWRKASLIGCVATRRPRTPATGI